MNSEESPAKFPERLRRLDLLFSSLRSFYFVTFNTYKRSPVLARPEIHQSFISFCVRAKERDVVVGAYVVMPDHVHLFVVMPETGITLSK